MAGSSLIAVLLISTGFGQMSSGPAKVRVAIVGYEDFHGEFEHFEQLFAELSRQEPALSFQLAVGSYGDVSHWIDRQLIDVAVLTPGVFADLLPSDRQQEHGTCRYLISSHVSTIGGRNMASKKGSVGDLIARIDSML